MKYTTHTDGGSRGNPGPAAIGIVIEKESEQQIEIAKAIGTTTNNTAEYLALLTALQTIQQNEKEKTCEVEVNCILDSELVVKQLNGQYKIKDANLQTYASEIKTLSKQFKQVTFQHVKRELNKNADRLVNQALDSTQKS